MRIESVERAWPGDCCIALLQLLLQLLLAVYSMPPPPHNHNETQLHYIGRNLHYMFGSHVSKWNTSCKGKRILHILQQMQSALLKNKITLCIIGKLCISYGHAIACKFKQKCKILSSTTLPPIIAFLHMCLRMINFLNFYYKFNKLYS